MGVNYGLEVYMLGNSCRPDTIYMDVDTPRIAKGIVDNEKWETLLRRPFELLAEVCGDSPYRTLRTNLVVKNLGETLLTARVLAGDAAGSENGYVVVSNIDWQVDPNAFASTDLITEYYWENGNLGLEMERYANLLSLDTAESYQILSTLKGVNIRRFRDYLAENNISEDRTPEQFAQLALERGYLPALVGFANTIFKKMLGRTSNGIGYIPSQLSPDERDNLVLAMAKLASRNHLFGIRLSNDLSSLGFDIERAIAVVANVGYDATIEDLRAVEGTDSPPSNFQMARAFGPALVANRCNGITSFLGSGSIMGAAGGIRQAGDACIISDENTTAFGYRLILKLDRIYNSECEGENGRYTCDFEYNLQCRTEGDGTRGMFGAAFCLPFQTARQPATATFQRLENGSWETVDFALQQR